jgi:hypothetical protein
VFFGGSSTWTKGTAGLIAVPYVVDYVTVNFAKPFSTTPVAIASLQHVDVAGSSARLEIGVSSVSADSITLYAFTWGDTIVYGVNANWIAFGS